MMHVVKAKEQPCQAKEILYGSTDYTVESHKASRGFKSDSVVEDILYGDQEEPKSKPAFNSVDCVSRDRDQQPCNTKEVVCSDSGDAMGKCETKQGSESDSVVQNIIYGGYEEPSGAKEATDRTHKPPCQAKEILYGGVDDTVKERATNHGFKSDSTMQDILYGGGWDQPRGRFTSTPEEPRLAIPVTTRGLPPLSVVQELLYPDAHGRAEEKVEASRPKEDGDAEKRELVQVKNECSSEGENEQGLTHFSQETSRSTTLSDSPHEGQLAKVS